ncbi:GH3 family domain-containing protein [Pinibacter soli]|uniref:GH3 auxin-responsive promoter family protein n=1 Tax=Pinibacter soli TaxID=3044211 RepID=A0ABT6RCB6_9BACT|nr:GH3 auxin-responsive promoter family protein [Pinibacter soli]MDI3320143.1 GH3 auxin-responsive promoter family protein [Pinibacter soli]
MALIDISLPKSVSKALNLPRKSPRREQLRVLKKLLKKARFTEFGQQYRFDEILLSRHLGKKFQEIVPTYNYNKIYNEYWHKTLEGKSDICWPGKIKYYALSSGTSEAASKYIPITPDLLRGNLNTMIKLVISLRNYEEIPVKAIGKAGLLLGGTTDLQRGTGYFAGDLSGITAKRMPFWFTPFYKPGKKIAKQKDWNKKLEEIVEQAPNWDIGYLTGVPAWIQMCLEKIIERYQLKTIHDIWPNLSFFLHGGVSFEPYKKGFEKLLGRPISYVETYLASEGFIAYQDGPGAKGMKLVTNEHIFLEFVPFDDVNFDGEGNMIEKPEVMMIHEVEEGRDYAILLSTSAGAWRYLIGDTIRFVNKANCEIVITGRTKHFLSLVGEHLSVENMTKAIQAAGEDLNICIPEFTVAGVPHDNMFAHNWYVACNDKADPKVLAEKIDAVLKDINDDYATERLSALKEVSVKVLPESAFMSFMTMKGKEGGQHKFPRVLKGKMLKEWEDFLAQHAY